MDGNGRWAQNRGQPRIFGHRQGIRSVRSVVEEGLPDRPRPAHALLPVGRELEAAPSRAEVPAPAAPPLPGGRVGRADGAKSPPDHDRPPRGALASTSSSSSTGLHRGDRREHGDEPLPGDQLRRPDSRSPTPPAKLAEDVRAGRLDPEGVDESTFAGYLSTAGMPDPDLLIRTAGELRVSNYPALADLLRRTLGDADPLARLPGGPPARGLRGVFGPSTQVRRPNRPGGMMLATRKSELFSGWSNGR